MGPLFSTPTAHPLRLAATAELGDQPAPSPQDDNFLVPIKNLQTNAIVQKWESVLSLRPRATVMVPFPSGSFSAMLLVAATAPEHVRFVDDAYVCMEKRDVKWLVTKY